MAYTLTSGFLKIYPMLNAGKCWTFFLFMGLFWGGSCTYNTATNSEDPLIGDWYVVRAYTGGRESKGAPKRLNDVSFLSLYPDGTYESRGYIFDLRRGTWSNEEASQIITIDNQDTATGRRSFNYRFMNNGHLELSNLTDGQIGVLTIELSHDKPLILQ